VELELIQTVKAFEGTAYFELLPGRYSGKFWNKGAVFMTEESFSFLEDMGFD
jgi:hypothetical protein